MGPDTPLTLDQFLDYLDVGEYDDDLKEIIERADERRNLVLKREARSFQPGDKLRFNETVSPKYLRGKVVEYVEPDADLTRRRGNPWVVVRAPMDRAFRRFSGGKFSSSLNTLTKVEP